MGIRSDVERLMKIDELVKEGLEDEVAVMKDISIELMNGLKGIRDVVSQTNFRNLTKESSGEILGNARRAIDSFVASLSALEGLDDRFEPIKRHSEFLRVNLEEFKNTLDVYGNSKKAVVDFENNVLYQFKITVLRDFEEDIGFNKRVEKALK